MKIPTDKTVYIARGVVYQDMGNHSFAIKDFNSALEIDSELSEAFFRRGVSKLYSKNFHDAINDFNAAFRNEEAEEDKRNHGIPDGLGCCYHALKETDKAIEYYNDAVKGDPSNVEFLMHRSQCYYDLKDFDKSVDDLKQGLMIK
jgi:tetratricopeptide (TPR) repeat protein